ncbi:MAG TPA: hypothetical protein ENJ08_12890 [Gammaproteobacteria bacterium]|nr:hypothetical protein [Gammaproteobacteria bacterium]
MSNTRQTRMIRLLTFVFTLIGVNAVYMSFMQNDFKMGVAGFSILTVCGFAFWYLGKSKEERKEPDAFLVQIAENKNNILHGGWDYRGGLITPETVITQYFFTFSLITISFKIPSRFYIVVRDKTSVINFIYSILSLILGWWAIPWGAVYTIQTLMNNSKGGNKIKVSSLVDV